MTATDHLEIGTISFARCESVMVLPSSGRQRLILAAVEAYSPDLLVTAGHAVDTVDDLQAMAALHSDLGTTTAIITEVLQDGLAPNLETHSMWAITGDGRQHRFGQQKFATRAEVNDVARDSVAKFESGLSA